MYHLVPLSNKCQGTSNSIWTPQFWAVPPIGPSISCVPFPAIILGNCDTHIDDIFNTLHSSLTSQYFNNLYLQFPFDNTETVTLNFCFYLEPLNTQLSPSALLNKTWSSATFLSPYSPSTPAPLKVLFLVTLSAHHISHTITSTVRFLSILLFLLVNSNCESTQPSFMPSSF